MLIVLTILLLLSMTEFVFSQLNEAAHVIEERNNVISSFLPFRLFLPSHKSIKKTNRETSTVIAIYSLYSYSLYSFYDVSLHG